MTVEDESGEACANGELVKEFQWAIRVLTGKWKGKILWQLV
jgi:DNA-binding HxlR family transcriptional regulator